MFMIECAALFGIAVESVKKRCHPIRKRCAMNRLLPKNDLAAKANEYEVSCRDVDQGSVQPAGGVRYFVRGITRRGRLAIDQIPPIPSAV